MRISELVRRLLEAKEKHGDVPVLVEWAIHADDGGIEEVTRLDDVENSSTGKIELLGVLLK